jgi:hypothetical protein
MIQGKSARARASGTNAFTETPDEVVRRVCRGLGNRKNIVVINDEAHHCDRGRWSTPSRDERRVCT